MKMKKILMATCCVALLGLAACAPTSETGNTDGVQSVPSETSVEAAKAKLGSFGIDLSWQDETVKPGDDFNRFVNGKWIDEFEMPADKSRYGIFNALADDSEKRVRQIIEDAAAKSPAADTLEGKIAAVYNAFMDTETIEAKGLEPLAPYFAKIDAAESRDDLAKLFAATGYSSPFGGWVDVDSKQTDEYIFYFQQSGLGMPDRSYYLEDTERNVSIKDAYTTLLSSVLTAAGEENGDTLAAQILALETEIAKAHWDRTLGRNRNLTYNKVTKDELLAMAGDFPLETMLTDLKIGGQSEFVIRQLAPTAEEIEENGLTPEDIENLSGGLPALISVAQTADMDAWKAYLKAHLVIDYASVLPAAIDDSVFEFYGKTLSGQPEQRPRWKRAVSTTESAVGEAVGKVYVERHFTAEAKAGMTDLVENLRKATKQNIENLAWMGDETKVQAQDKLAKFTPKIGYPETFETYDSLIVSADDAFGNRIAVSEWGWNDMISQLGQPIDKDEWFMTPQQVNAYYSPNRNEIVFPAAILQPPFYDLAADPAVNYGAIGAVIGHEMGHGFDDQGSKSDGDGVLRNWWTDDDLAAFKERTGNLVAQYNGFCPIDPGGEAEMCVNGALALGENIGDVGGLSMAYTAYQLSLNGEEAPIIDGLTGDQRFYLAWAQVWQAKYREEALKTHLTRGPHSPPEFRINGVVRNQDAWYEAFNVQPGDALYLPPEERVKIW